MDFTAQIKGFILNLDGVLVDTAKYHYTAWQRLANQWGFDLSTTDHESLRWLSRWESLEKIMEWGGITYMTEAEKLHWSDVKNNWYIELVNRMTPADVLPGVVSFLENAQSADIRIALSSASQNARSVLESVGLARFFLAVIDGNTTRRTKPNPECFLMAAQGLDLSPCQCIVFDDAPAGVLAAHLSGFGVVGIGAGKELMPQADLVIAALADFPLSQIFPETHVILNV